MMPDMSNDRQPNETAGRWWVLPALAAIMALYVLWMGETLAWHHQHGAYWFFLAPWWTPTSLKFLAIAAAAAVAARFAGDARGRRGWPWVLGGLLLGGEPLVFTADRGGDVREVFWHSRQADVWGQIAAILCGGVAVAVLFREERRGK